ncbi:MAG: hypothetical protein IMZ44_12095 [Planctomycetes bacterium]|nr:hypothetical protein [Planctomycetota bacterium]
MNLTARHRRIARTLWDCGGRLDEAAAREHVRIDTLRRWLADPQFRALLAQDALEPLLQATSAMLRWAPAAVARLIQDLESESAGDARQAAREILKLALDAQKELAPPADPAAARRAAGSSAADPAAEPQDPLSRRIAALSDRQLAHLLAVLNGKTPEPSDA